MDPDPIKRSLDEIEQELESALANLNATNQRVDDLLADYGSGDFTPRTPPAGAPAAEIDDTEDAAADDSGVEEAPPEY